MCIDSINYKLYLENKLKMECDKMSDLKSVTVKLSLGEVTQTGDKVEVPLLLNGEYVKTISATIGQDGKLHREGLNETKGEVDNMKLNLIPNLIFTNDRGETFRVETQEAVIRIGNSILLKHTYDIGDELNKTFKEAKGVKLELEYHTLDENEQPLGITTRQVYVSRYEVREYYNTSMDKNDMIYLFSTFGENTKELLEEYRHRQMLESLKQL